MWYKNIRAQNYLIIFLSLLGLACSMYFVNLKLTLNSEEKHQIEKAVFSGIFQHIISHPDENPDFFFISIENSDPSQKLLDAFKDQKPTVEPISASTMTFGFSASIIHKTDRRMKGMRVNLKELETVPAGNVKATASIYQDKGTAANYVFTLSKTDGKFTISSVAFPEREESINKPL